MIVENQLKNNDVVNIRTVAGEELVAKFISEDSDSITIRYPLVMAIQVDGSVGAAPFMLGVDPKKDISLNRAGVLTYFKSNKQLADDYIKVTTGLTMNTNGIII